MLLYYRQLVASSLNEMDTCIGGDGVIVELDESKFGKRKYHRGHRVDGVWILGGIARTAENKSFVCVVKNRISETLLDVISRHVAEGSIVFTDMWKGYDMLEELLNLRHFTVNHSSNFKDPETGVHTNTIEGYWNGMKLRITPRNRTEAAIGPLIMEHIWRRKHKDDEWNGLLSAFKEVSFD
jgi:transposase-like protein